LGAGILALAAITGRATAAEPPQFEVDSVWPKPLPNNWILGQVAGIAVDAQDHVWIIQRPRTLTDDEKGATLDPPRNKCCAPAPPVIEFDQEGNLVQAWGGPGDGYDWPKNEHGIRVDPSGFVWLGGNAPDDGMILKFARDGKFVMQIGKAGPSKGDNDPTQLGRPADVWIDQGEAYVADGYGNHRIVVFDAETGAYKRHWGAYGKRPTDEESTAARPAAYNPAAPPSQTFGNPVHCVKIAKDGLVYVCDRVNNRIQVFQRDGGFVQEFVQMKQTRGAGSAWDLYLWPDRRQSYFLTADGENNEVRVIRRQDGEIVGTFGRSGRNAGFFHWIHNIAIDSQGNVFTSEVDTGKRVQKFRPVNGTPER
jgi:DNA-binding beta-propeller fold protein YncE